jgi:hypothetical protein
MSQTRPQTMKSSVNGQMAEKIGCIGLTLAKSVSQLAPMPIRTFSSGLKPSQQNRRER